MCEAKKDGKVISFINMKGGVGKTTLAINIGYTLVKHFHKDVLLIDMDPQFNATQALITKSSSIEAYQELRKNNKTIASLQKINLRIKITHSRLCQGWRKYNYLSAIIGKS